jgi:hypothetical protein
MKPRGTDMRPRRVVRQIPNAGSPPAVATSASKARNDDDPKRWPVASPVEDAPNGAPVLK